ncbi:L-iditol 2-dehydrogenase [Fusarium oxysporum f. sp. radicis-lycopersici 26381]|uniref:L-arabinitol 4-dehydrogenase n=1 Tax=Fusarium oxysporum f. sp. cepae TaxID=396571 RepID=A0A3L6NRZ3_FUSOX|nr:L-iditol 2-dehydrogenase [Fusarium oxysporum f. sp. radicis-lycopersici 26381]RKK21920.1 L-arabinitol 4-dehydrogenase [Fusarium oxysporum f. sp. cepae]RKK39797.1 L-arabinitol 4-dehydrogenase [Fusarium oxysporum f. sp. cepae]RKK48412.1 L-arabinitol 4-dehydrogenase [Fusarium oxysporum f. sp. cepae]
MTVSSLTDILSRKPENVAVYTNPEHELYLHRSEAPKPGPGACLVHVRATGICGSDVHFWKKGGIGDMKVVGANGLGHESAGVIVAVGSGVTRFQVGDRVAIECGIPCMKATCFYCRTGQYNACPDVVFYSTPPYHGTLARYHVHPEEWLHKIPDSMTYEEGSLVEPLAVALAGIERSNLRLGDPLVICGAGPIGITTLLAASAAGANPIAITDINERRLAFAKKLVPRVQTVAILPGKQPQEAAADVKKALGQEARVVVECTGVESSVATGIYSCRFGGLVFVIGCGKDFQTLPFMHLSTKEIDLRFQYRYHDIYPRAIGLVASGVIDVKPLVTHRFSLEESEDAFNTASDPTAMAVKVQILDE